MKAKPVAYNAKGSHVEEEAMEKKHGGKVVEKMDGKKAKHRMDKKPRKAAGGATWPWSAAAKPKPNTEA